MNSEEKAKIGGIFNNPYFRNIFWIIICIFSLIIGASILLNLITNHGKSIEVPDFTNMTVSEAKYNAGIKHIKVDVIDSVYVKRMRKGAVFSQNPKPGAAVKKGRKIRLVVNSMTPKKVMMPNLVGYSMRQAHAELISRSLNLGRLIYIDDMATNNVIRQVYKNREIKPGEQINSGSEIDLVVGLNSSENQTTVPNVTGMKYLRAVNVVHDYSLNVSNLIFDGSVKTYSDSLDAIVYKQGPTASNVPIIMGASVSMYLTIDPGKIPSSSK